MKKIGPFFIPLFILGILWLSGCFDKKNPEVIDDCITPEDCALNEPIADDLSNKYLTAFGTEPFWSIEISGGIAKFSSPMYETDIEVTVNIWKEGENYYFSGEELEGEFTKKDCIDGGKGDLHYYTVGIAKFREYYYEGCGDDEKGIKLSDEEIPEQYRETDNVEELQIQKIVEERIANGFSDIQSCMESLDQYPVERMPGDPQTIITVGCGPLNYGQVIVTGYVYSTTYPDLGIRITTPKGYNTFYKKSETPILVREGNKISYSDDYEYIRVYEKSEDESLLDIINAKHLNPNCSAHKRLYEDLGSKIVFGALDETIYDIHYEDDHGRIFYEECIADDEAEEPNYKIVRYFESPDKTKYYKLVFMDGCAPGPCTIFGEVELF